MGDVARIVNGVVTQVWRGTTLEILGEQPGAGALVEAADGDAVCGMAYNAGVFTAPANSEPEFGITPPQLVAAALNIVVSGGDIPAVDGAYNVIGAFYDDVGLYTLYFLNAQQDTNYFALASGVTLREVDKQTDYLTVEALNANGSRFDPSRFGVNIYRI